MFPKLQIVSIILKSKSGWNGGYTLQILFLLTLKRNITISLRGGLQNFLPDDHKCLLFEIINRKNCTFQEITGWKSQ